VSLYVFGTLAISRRFERLAGLIDEEAHPDSPLLPGHRDPQS
jgi:hypothetical protein